MGWYSTAILQVSHVLEPLSAGSRSYRQKQYVCFNRLPICPYPPIWHRFLMHYNNWPINTKVSIVSRCERGGRKQEQHKVNNHPRQRANPSLDRFKRWHTDDNGNIIFNRKPPREGVDEMRCDYSQLLQIMPQSLKVSGRLKRLWNMRYFLSAWIRIESQHKANAAPKCFHSTCSRRWRLRLSDLLRSCTQRELL